jgi:hypothetical protein
MKTATLPACSGRLGWPRRDCRSRGAKEVAGPQRRQRRSSRKLHGAPIGSLGKTRRFPPVGVMPRKPLSDTSPATVGLVHKLPGRVRAIDAFPDLECLRWQTEMSHRWRSCPRRRTSPEGPDPAAVSRPYWSQRAQVLASNPKPNNQEHQNCRSRERRRHSHSCRRCRRGHSGDGNPCRSASREPGPPRPLCCSRRLSAVRNLSRLIVSRRAHIRKNSRFPRRQSTRQRIEP